MTDIQESHPRQPNIAVELALLLMLATLWGASYSFIKVGVTTIPPVTLIAARTLIAGLLLLVIMRWRGSDAADGRRDLAALPVPGLPQQRDSLDHAGVERALARRRARDHPEFHVADLHLLPDARHHPP